MRTARSFSPTALRLSLFLAFCVTFACPGAELVTPEAHFGFKPGTDRMLLDYDQLIGYLQKLTSASPRMKLTRSIGRRRLPRPMGESSG